MQRVHTQNAREESVEKLVTNLLNRRLSNPK
jgi:hypothetical protein